MEENRELPEDIHKDLLWLEALGAAGVDNWEGIGYARELFQEYLEADRALYGE